MPYLPIYLYLYLYLYLSIYLSIYQSIYIYIYNIYIYIYIYIYICTEYTSVANPVHKFMARSGALKSCLVAKHTVSIVLCILVVFRYIFSTFTTSRVLTIQTISFLSSSIFLMFSSSDKSLNCKTRLSLPRNGSLVILHTLAFLFLYHIYFK